MSFASNGRVDLEVKTVDQEEVQEQEEAQAEEAPPAKSKKKLILIIGSVLLVLVSGVLGAYYGGVFASDEPIAGQEAEQDYPEVNQTLELDSLVIQLSDKGRKPRFVRLSLTLGIYRAGEDGEVPEIPQDPLFKPRLQDRLIFAVGAKSSQDLGSMEGREALKSELLKEIARVFPEEWGEVLELYITEMLIQ